VADASKFRVLGKFDGAVCTFDSLNHILSEEELSAALARTSAALKPGGVFLNHAISESVVARPDNRDF
jgi:cyclopropane fatty-acyl-phospholipid synthase-like methyltransferase